MEVGWRSRAGGIRDSGKVGVWVGVGVGAGGVWRRVVVCAARRPVWVVHGLSVLFSYLILSYPARSRGRGARPRGPQGPRRASVYRTRRTASARRARPRRRLRTGDCRARLCVCVLTGNLIFHNSCYPRARPIGASCEARPSARPRAALLPRAADAAHSKTHSKVQTLQ